MSQLDLHAHVMAVLSGLEDLSVVSLRALREALESRFGISLRDQKREIRHHAESAIAELSDRACFARESAQRAAEDCVAENNPGVAVWQSLPHADRGRRLFTESEWHDDVNTVQQWRGVWEPISRRAWEHSKVIPGMDLGGHGGDLGVSMHRGVHVYARYRVVNWSCFYRGLFSRYVAVDGHCNQASGGKRLDVDTAPGQKKLSSVDDEQLDPYGVAFNLEVFVHNPCIARCSSTFLSGCCHFVQTACGIDVWGCVTATFGDLWDPGGKLRQANTQLEHEHGRKSERFQKSYSALSCRGCSWSPGWQFQ
eukprot:CAMPEP_0181448698 /NCGR_PEP_ID=MMETSP1110-20121109/27274_1 /TAXON_ID=174948 /ORGANISM="Symbiodinium sp., Strain CCMP421" /LENGTH=308 /DNA_ID=CAMNT_0023572855 /DNA_START=86 /DNA_END=1012 /DNA_ORIENTATION=+